MKNLFNPSPNGESETPTEIADPTEVFEEPTAIERVPSTQLRQIIAIDDQSEFIKSELNAMFDRLRVKYILTVENVTFDQLKTKLIDDALLRFNQDVALLGITDKRILTCSDRARYIAFLTFYYILSPHYQNLRFTNVVNNFDRDTIIGIYEDKLREQSIDIPTDEELQDLFSADYYNDLKIAETAEPLMRELGITHRIY